MAFSTITKQLLILSAMAAVISVAVATTDMAETIHIHETVNEDLYAAARSIQIMGKVNGDATLAAQRIMIEQPVAGDVNAAAEIITIDAEVTDDVRAAGRMITISGHIGDHAIAVGETIVISARASIAGWARFAGRQLEIDGNIGHDLAAAAQTIRISGQIDGNVDLTAETIILDSTARIAGKLTYRSANEAVIREGARVDGSIERKPLPETEEIGTNVIKAVLGMIVIAGLSFLVYGLVYQLLFPSFSTDCSRHIRQRTLPALGLGVAVLFTTPFLILLLMMTVIGSLLALSLLVIYLLSLLTGIVNGILFITDLLLEKIFRQSGPGRAKRALAYCLGSLLFAVIVSIPLLGALLMLFVLISGIGALYLQAWHQYSEHPGHHKTG